MGTPADALPLARRVDLEQADVGGRTVGPAAQDVDDCGQTALVERSKHDLLVGVQARGPAGKKIGCAAGFWRRAGHA
ncbi:hypothetical protein [Nocardioides panacisoli]|uniref:hypothetical protein n=1 Tax=Nocardioides panacisoli TaxID=627624 RepID=UPI0031DAD706